MKKIKPFYIYLGPCIAFAFVIMSYFFMESSSEDQLFWANQKKTNLRTIASSFDELEFEAYRDYFLPNTFDKYIEYTVSPRFWTDKDGKYLKKKINLALHDTFIQAYTKKETSSDSFLTLFKGSLVKNLLSKFIKTLYIFKIFNGTYQFDFHFVPEKHPEIDLKKELSTNQLIDTEGDNLFSQVTAAGATLVEKVINANLPYTNERYQYSGGTISIWFKVLDMAWNPLRPIPNPKKNAVKGFVRYRRYFRVNSQRDLQIDLRTKKINLNVSQFKPAKGLSEAFITVDIYKSFNLEDMIPKLDRLEIDFGNLLPTNLKKGSLVRNIFAKKEKKIRTGYFYLHGGHVIERKKHQVKVQILKLIYDFNKNQFSDKSKIKVTLKRLSKASQLKVKKEIKESIYTELASQMIEQLRLDRFHPELISGGQE